MFSRSNRKDAVAFYLFIALFISLQGTGAKAQNEGDEIQSGKEGKSDSIQVVGSPSCDTTKVSKSESEVVDEIFKKLSQYIVINKDTGETKFIPTENFIFCKDGKSREFCKVVGDLIKKRSPEEQERINQALTDKLRDYGMSFTEKRGKKVTFFDVPVNGIPMVLTRKSFDTLVDSTGPVLRANRVLDQIFYSKESKDSITPAVIRTEIEESTGKKIQCSDEDLDSMLISMKASIYDITKLHGPSMRYYPYMAIAGVDAMIDQPEPGKIRPIFAEFNLGTPSGISNIRYALSSWIESDPEMAAPLLSQMAEDHTYQNLRTTIENNAASWTGKTDGISVIMGAEVENGAHPDISSISFFSGMPLVKKKDLYIDGNGDVRLNTGSGQSHPIVTGMYSRSEESYLLNDQSGTVPFISPSYNDIEGIFAKIISGNPSKYECLKNPKIQKGLIQGAGYKFIYAVDIHGKINFDDIVGVQLDEDCNPVLDVYNDQLGIDPNGNGTQGSLVEAIKNRKLYTNVIGGRLLDDKKVFEIVSKCIAPLYMNGEQYIAAPPKSYTPEEFVPLLQKATDEELGDFVLKEPDGSSGNGVEILINYPPEERRKIVDHYLKNPSMVKRMVVQEFVHAAAMTMPMSRKGVSRYYQGGVLNEIDALKLEKFQPKYLTQANDLRIFTMMDANGKVVADPHSVLVRAAKPTIHELGINGESRSNTGKGGGYGVLAVLEETDSSRTLVDKGELMSHPEKLLAAEAKQSHLAGSKKEELNDFLNHLNNVDQWLSNFEEGKDDLWLVSLENIRTKHRKIMEVLGPKYAPLMFKARKIHDSVTHITTNINGFDTDLVEKTDLNKELIKLFHGEMAGFIKHLCQHPPTHIEGLVEMITSHPLCKSK